MQFSRYFIILLFAILFTASHSLAGSYNYISADDLESRLTTNQPTSIVDIQVEKEYSQHHLKGAIPTYAYPVKSDADRSKLDAAIDEINTNSNPVVIVCPRGGGGAKRTYDYLLQLNVTEERLFILEKGQRGWTRASHLVSK